MKEKGNKQMLLYESKDHHLRLLLFDLKKRQDDD